MSALLNALMTRQPSNVVDVERLGPGSVVVVKSGFGGDAPETVTLDGFEWDGKNGKSTIDYVDKDGDGRWAYTDQIQRVISY
ncbi:hypothetical protein UFOVP1516_34 [uncultured Caudovirales phage]|uniref:Uncharacterized protein n=1 Tax=uncultured Caudovirales phage TaxID=2100421 RepID=A0A6J7X793_9CAUD|nr:hypothetical protein UFOVP887_10 [uncultured Caudovirales phage]CAB5226820.1 hypothetical protein UFOVP1516_34 [uncultured Caudovirales phage]